MPEDFIPSGYPPPPSKIETGSGDGPGHGDIHVLIVREVGDDENDFEDYEVIHRPECFRERPFPEQQIWGSEQVCGVGWELDNTGSLKWQLKYAGTPVTHPGVFRIESWHEIIHNWQGPDEADGGIGLVG